jgi:hypothetical protein
VYKVIKNFIDKETMKKHITDSEYTPSSAKRGKELVELGYLKEIKKKPKKGEKK